MKLPILVAAAMLIPLCASVATAEEKPTKRAPLTLALSARIAPAPAQVTARISVEPDPRSRLLTVEWWSVDGSVGSHEVTLDGDRAAARQDFAIKQMSAGDYVVRVIVVRDDGSVLKKESSIIVVGENSRFLADTRGELVLDRSGARR